jgi:hypothetical protein
MIRASKGASRGSDETTPASTTRRRRMKTMPHEVKGDKRRERSIQPHVERELECRSSKATLSTTMRVLCGSFSPSMMNEIGRVVETLAVG